MGEAPTFKEIADRAWDLATNNGMPPEFGLDGVVWLAYMREAEAQLYAERGLERVAS